LGIQGSLKALPPPQSPLKTSLCFSTPPHPLFNKPSPLKTPFSKLGKITDSHPLSSVPSLAQKSRPLYSLPSPLPSPEFPQTSPNTPLANCLCFSHRTLSQHFFFFSSLPVPTFSPLFMPPLSFFSLSLQILCLAQLKNFPPLVQLRIAPWNCHPSPFLGIGFNFKTPPTFPSFFCLFFLLFCSQKSMDLNVSSITPWISDPPPPVGHYFLLYDGPAGTHLSLVSSSFGGTY